jgi:hypothetical protein
VHSFVPEHGQEVVALVEVWPDFVAAEAGKLTTKPMATRIDTVKLFIASLAF